MIKKIGWYLAFLVMTIAVFGSFSYIQYRGYLHNYNERINALCTTILERYPEVSEQELMDIMNEDEPAKDNLFQKYGIDLDKDAIILENQSTLRNNIIIAGILSVVWGSLVALAFLIYRRRNQKDIRTVTGYLEDINKGDYSFDMDNLEERDISILESEVYKTTIMLKEAAEQSKHDKESLKDSLSDISHQLKTPLTSMIINLDNLRDNPDLDDEHKRVIINHAKRDANKMSQMVQQLLTLSRFDADVVVFSREDTKLSDFVENAIEDVSALADLKGIEIVISNLQDGKAVINCDPYWEAQAVGNILKNGIEHAKGLVRISYMNCELYKEIVIENDGEPISEQDRKNIFERFYQGESSGNDSVGIGLSLSNVIVKQDGGYIVAEADNEKHLTRFIIRYT